MRNLLPSVSQAEAYSVPIQWELSSRDLFWSNQFGSVLLLCAPLYLLHLSIKHTVLQLSSPQTVDSSGWGLTLVSVSQSTLMKISICLALAVPLSQSSGTACRPSFRSSTYLSGKWCLDGFMQVWTGLWGGCSWTPGCSSVNADEERVSSASLVENISQLFNGIKFNKRSSSSNSAGEMRVWVCHKC
jgi:hypothetical protein